MAFWKQNESVPGWQAALSSWWRDTPPRLLDSNGPLRPLTSVRGVSVRRASSVEDLQAIPRFWWRFYSVSSKVRCEVPYSVLEERWRSGSWEVWIALGPEGLIGTVIRRRYRNVRIGKARFPEASGVDYFCIHPAWRSKGVGRLLLNILHNAQRPLQLHFIFWEQFQISIPPLTSGWLWSRMRGTKGESWKQIEGAERDARWAQISKPLWYCETPEWKETSLWTQGTQWVCIWDQYHRTIPEGHRLALILFASSEEATTQFTEWSGSPWGVYCRGSSTPFGVDSGWTLDSPYCWIGYNLSGGHGPVGEHPLLCS